jgi:RNA polymerase sigma-70 factor (ECF subfamily)
VNRFPLDCKNAIIFFTPFPAGLRVMQSRQAFENLADEVLMRMYLSGDQNAFEIVYRRRRDGLRRFFERQCGSAAVAKELAQDAWFRLIRACQNGNYTAEAKFTTYLYKLGKNRSIDWGRKYGSYQTEELHEEIEDGDENIVPLTSGQRNPEQLYAEKEKLEAVLAAVESLSVEQRMTLLMQIEGNMSYDEIAEAMNTNRETVKTRLRYARDHLKKRVLKAHAGG